MPEARPLLLCFDGSPNAERAISVAGELFPGRAAVVVTVWRPIGQFGPRNPLGAYVEAPGAPRGLSEARRGAEIRLLATMKP